MNKFINNPDRLGSLAALAFWVFAFAGGSAVLWVALLRLAGLAR